MADENNDKPIELPEPTPVALVSAPAGPPRSFDKLVQNEDTNKVQWRTRPEKAGEAGTAGARRKKIDVRDPVSDDKDSPDPTAPFERDSRGYRDISLKQSDVDRWANELRDNCVLLLSSVDSELLYAASEAILFHSTFTQDEKRDVRSETLNRTIDELIVDQAARKSRRVIAAYATDASSAPFLKTLRPDGPTVAKQRARLKDHGVSLLIVARTSLWIEVEQRDVTQRFPYAESAIDFLDARLRPVYQSETDKIVQRVLDQRRNDRLWGTSDERFLVNIRESLRNRTLDQKLHEYDAAIKAGTADKFREELQPVIAESLLDSTPGGDQELQHLYHWVLFIATFFPDLGMAEFTNILRQLIPPPPSPPENSSKEGPPVPRPKNLFDSWALNQRKILGICQLHQESRRGFAPAIKFIEPEVHRQMQEAFLGPYYGHYYEAFVRIEEARLIADPNPLIRNAVVELLAERAAREEDYYGRSYVNDILRGYVKARTGSAPEFTSALTSSLQALSAEDRSILFERLVAVIVHVASGKRPIVAEYGLSQLQSGGYFEPIFNVLGRAPEGDVPPAIAAKAAGILLKSLEVGTRFLVLTNAFGEVSVDLDGFLEAQTLYFIRMTLRDPANGSLLTALIADLPRELATDVLKYLCQYALKGFLNDSRANPIAVAISGIAGKPNFQSDQLAKIAEYLASEDFSSDLSEEVFWGLFCFWLAPEALQEGRVNLHERLIPAIDSAMGKLDEFLSLHSRASDSLKSMRVLALLLADTGSWIDDPASATALSTQVGKQLDRKRRGELILFLNELANAMNVSILSLQAPDAVFDKAERQKRLVFIDRWKRLRDALRAVKTSISDVIQ